MINNYADYASYIHDLKSRLRDYHDAVLKRKYDDAYLIACDITELAQSLEDWTQRICHA